MRLTAISMIRNEADIIHAFLNHAIKIFDEILIVDICSTDGTREILEEYRDRYPQIKIYTTKIQEKFQSAYTTCLSLKAFEAGADWVFFLDGDEFLNVNEKKELIKDLSTEESMVIQLPWINLIPKIFGVFSHFDMSQEFLWRGRVSKYTKVAISRKLYELDLGYVIDEGSHNVLNGKGHYYSGPMKLSILHLPIRSLERLEYKIKKAYEMLVSKGAAKKEGEGSHVVALNELINSAKIDERFLQYLAAYYAEWNFDWGFKNFQLMNHWPKKKFLNNQNPLFEVRRGSNLEDTVRLDREITWDRPIIENSFKASAILKGEVMKLAPKPLTALGNFRPDNIFRALEEGSQSISVNLDKNFIANLIHMSFKEVDAITFSAWSELVPLQFAIFTIMRPRRYVELGTHNGMSFFAACQAKKNLSLQCECVAIDSWKGDEHASYYSEEVFEKFKSFLSIRHQEEYYIRSLFINALECFESGSIDLLHIDGLHTYEAVKEDFETWLPKMSDRGVIMFHDTNVYKTGFGVWRLWGELKGIYPSYEFKHSHGLGIIYVGREKGILSKILEMLNDPIIDSGVQSFFESLGELAIKHKLASTRLYDLNHKHQAVSYLGPTLIQSRLNNVMKNYANKLLPLPILNQLKKAYRYCSKVSNS